jgi:nitrate reductase NapE component
MNDLTRFKNKIFLYAVIVMVIFEIVSIPFLGLDIKFGYGLLLGTCISIANFNILAFTLNRVLSGGNKAMVFFSYMLRLAIYGVALINAFNVNNLAALGCALGFITVKVSIYYLHGFKAKFSTDRKVRPEVQEQFEKEDLEKELKKERKRNGLSEEE